MIKLTRNINWNTILEINNTSINLVYKKWKLYLSKKDIWELFWVEKSLVKEVGGLRREVSELREVVKSLKELW